MDDGYDDTQSKGKGLLPALGLTAPKGTNPQGGPGGKNPEPPKAKPKASPNLKVLPRPDFAYGSIADLADHLRSLVERQGDGELGFDPPLSSVGEPRKYAIKVSVAEGTQHLAAGPVDLAFEIQKADAALVVGPLADFKYDTVKDIPQAIKDVVKHQGDGIATFDPALDTVGAPKKYTIQVGVGEGTKHKPAGPKPLTFEIQKLEPVLKLPAVADREYNGDEEKTFLKNLVASIRKSVTTDGAVRIDPAPEKLKYQAGEFAIKVSTGEGALYKKSEVEVLVFKIFLNARDLSGSFSKWWQNANAKQKQQLGSEKKAKPIYCGDPSARVPPPIMYTSEAEFFAALDVASAGLPSKSVIWNALGYPALNNASAWLLVEKGTTSLGAKMHMTISFGNIATPTTAAFWAQADQAIYDALFRTVSVPMRLHMSLEDFPTAGRNFHVFLGKGTPAYVNGVGEERLGSDADDQVADLITEFETFETAMKSTIGTVKATIV